MPIQLTKELKHGKGKHELIVQVTVRSAAGWDKYQEQVLFRHIWKMVMGRDYIGEDIWSLESRVLNDFVEVVNRTVKVTGLPIAFPTPQSTEQELCAGFNYIKEIPLSIYQAWLNMLEEVETAPGDSDLFPPETLTEEQKKA